MSKYDTSHLKNCPICKREMKPDLILKDGRGVNLSPAEPEPADIAGYGFFCESCQRGWTGDELSQMARERKPSDPRPRVNRATR